MKKTQGGVLSARNQSAITYLQLHVYVLLDDTPPV